MSQQKTLGQPLRDIVAGSKALWGGQITFNEAAFTGATAQVKDMIKPALQGVGRGSQQGTILMTKINTLEGYVAKQGTGRVFGRVVVKKAEFERLVEDICVALQALAEFLPVKKSA